MFYNFFKISILSLCIIILIHYIINYLKNTLTAPKIIDHTFNKRIQKNIKLQKEVKEVKEEENINFMKDELTDFLNKQIKE
jgi:hypothetical protein